MFMCRNGEIMKHSTLDVISLGKGPNRGGGDAHKHLTIGCTTSNALDRRVHYKSCWPNVAKKKLTIGQLK